MSQPAATSDEYSYDNILNRTWERSHMRAILMNSIFENPFRVLDIIDDMLWIPDAYTIAKDQLLLGHPSRRDIENNNSRRWRKEQVEKGIDTSSLPKLQDDAPFIADRPFLDMETKELEAAKKQGFHEGREKGRLEGREEGRRLGEKSGIERGMYQGLERGRRLGEESGYAKGYAEGCKSDRLAEAREQGFKTGKTTGEEIGYAKGYAKGLADGMGRVEGLVLKSGSREKRKAGPGVEGQPPRKTRRGGTKRRAARQETVAPEQE